MCAANTEHGRERYVPEGLLPHDDLEAWRLGSTRGEFGDGMQLKPITAYREMEALFGRDGDNSALEYSRHHDEDQEQFSQELQLSSQGNDTLDWIARSLLPA